MLQEERHCLENVDYDIVYECWTVADSLSLHALASECEWALMMLWWENEYVRVRAKHTDNGLSKDALGRIISSMCEGMDNATWEVKTKGDEHLMRRYKVAPASTMMQWRMRDEEQAASRAAK